MTEKPGVPKNQEKEQRPQDKVVVCALTSYEDYRSDPIDQSVDQRRGAEALQTLRTLSEKGYVVYIGDHHSSTDFLREASTISGITIEESNPEKDMSDQRVDLLQIAAHTNKPFILVMELDTKGSLINDIPELINKAEETNAAVVVPIRNKRALNRLSKWQRGLEERAVRRTKEQMKIFTNLDPDKLPNDIWFGPKLIRAEHLVNFTDHWPDEISRLDPRYRSLNLAVLRAMIRGHTVVGYEVEGFKYPEDVVAIEHNQKFNEKRIRQFKDQLRASRAFFRTLSSPTSSETAGSQP